MKLLCISLCLLFWPVLMHAQQQALGIRINGGTLLDAEISYQVMLNDDDNRIEADLGFGGGSYFNVLKFSGIYQWVFELEYPLLWYAGLGASAGFWSYDEDFVTPNDDSGLFMNLAGQVGCEYTFEVPIQISLDFKPEFGILNKYNTGFDGGVGLGIRYKF